MSMQVVYGLIHAVHQLQSQLSLPVLMPTMVKYSHGHVMCAMLVDGLLMMLASAKGRPFVLISSKQGATQDDME